jgi:hypothetical protein
VKQSGILALSVIGCCTVGAAVGLGCAQPESASTASTSAGSNGKNGSNGSATNGTGGHDLAGLDLSGSSSSPDFAGVDLNGVDLSMSQQSNVDMAGSCDVVAQTGCAASDKCVPAMPANVCVNATGTSDATASLCLASMTPPSADDECAKGDGCIGASDINNMNTVNLCLQWCHKDADCKQTTVTGGLAPRCDVPLMDTTAYQVCSVSCNPYMAAAGMNGCPAGLSCVYLVDDMRDKPNTFEFTDCLHYGAVAKNGDCGAHGTEDCAPGMICVTLPAGTNPQNQCRVVCRTSNGNGDCGVGQMCSTFFAGAKFGACN